VPDQEIEPTVLQRAAPVVPTSWEPERQGAAVLPWQRPERQGVVVQPWKELERQEAVVVPPGQRPQG